MKCCSMRMSFDLFDKLLNSDMFCFLYNWLWQSWCREINFVFLFLIHRHGFPRTCLIFFFNFIGIDTQLCVDSNPPTGVTVLVECLMSSWSNKIPFSTSLVDSCQPTGLPVLDNWVLDFGWICWGSSQPPATSESYSFIQLSLKEIVRGGGGDTYTLWYMISSDFITIAFETQ